MGSAAVRGEINACVLGATHQGTAPVTHHVPHERSVYGSGSGMSSVLEDYRLSYWTDLMRAKEGEIITLVSAPRYSLCSFMHSSVINCIWMGGN